MRSRRNQTSILLPWLAVAGFVFAGLSCSSDSGGPTGPQEPTEDDPEIQQPVDLSGIIVTEPVSLEVSDVLSSAIPVSLFSNAGDELSYVSYAPGSQPEADSVDVLNLTRNLSVGAPMIDGGLDPVAIPASVGDTLEITTLRDGTTFDLKAREVPKRKPPVIVRTDPPSGKTRVPLNSVIIVVFSEPVDESSISQISVRLLRGDLGVSTVLDLAADGLSLKIVPDSNLEPSATYTLALTTVLSDLSGEALEDEFASEFTTVPEATGIRTTSTWDGTIALLSNRDGSGGYANGPWQIHLMEDEVQNLTRVSEFSVETPFPYHIGPQLSPDGSRIAFLHFGDIWIVNADGSDLANLTLSGEVSGPPAWSPDGNRIAYAAGTDVSYIDIIGVGGSEPAIHAAPGVGRPDWSPDGSKLVFQVPSGEVGVVGADGSGFQILYIPTPGSKHPRWSPDGSRVLFEGAPGTLDVMNADGSGHEVLVSLQGVPVHPQWSPDGSRIAFLRRLPTCGWPCVVSIIDSAGGDLVEIHDFKDTPQFHLIWPIAWSPDGSRLAFSVRWLPIDRIFMVNSDGTDLRRITDGAMELESYIIGSWVP